MNVFLYDGTAGWRLAPCRRLKPGLQILSRATLDRNVSTLYRAGADIVLSFASMGANAIFNL